MSLIDQHTDLKPRILLTKQGATRQRALDFLSSIDEEQILQLALMADASDEEISLKLGGSMLPPDNVTDPVFDPCR